MHPSVTCPVFDGKLEAWEASALPLSYTRQSKGLSLDRLAVFLRDRPRGFCSRVGCSAQRGSNEGPSLANRKSRRLAEARTGTVQRSQRRHREAAGSDVAG